MSPKSTITHSVDFKPSIDIIFFLFFFIIFEAIALICLDEVPLAIIR